MSYYDVEKVRPSARKTPTIKINVLGAGRLPTKGTELAGCYDLYVRHLEVEDGKVKYYLGIKTELPEGYDAIIMPRSSIHKMNLKLSNSVGYIDNDYRGEWMAVFYTEKNSKLYEIGDRCCQFRLIEKIPFAFEPVSELSETKRGEGGFGSTGI